VVHRKHDASDIMQTIGYLITNFWYLDMKNIKKLLDWLMMKI